MKAIMATAEMRGKNAGLDTFKFMLPDLSLPGWNRWSADQQAVVVETIRRELRDPVRLTELVTMLEATGMPMSTARMWKCVVALIGFGALSHPNL